MVGKWMRAIMLFRKDPSTLMYCHDFSSDNLNWFGVNFCVSWTHKNAPYKIIFYADYDIIKTHVMCCLAWCGEWGPLGVVWALANVSCNNHFFHLVKKTSQKRYPFLSSNKEYRDVKNVPIEKKIISAHQPALHFLHWASCPRCVHVFDISGLVICSCLFELFSGKYLFYIWYIGCNIYYIGCLFKHSNMFVSNMLFKHVCASSSFFSVRYIFYLWYIGWSIYY